MRNASVALFGLGSVGLPIALGFAKAGFTTTGVDNDPQKVDALQSGIAPWHEERTNRLLAKLLKTGRFQAASKISLTEHGPDFIVLCLPTPLTSDNQPDLSYLTGICTELSGQDLRKKCVILESSVYPGVTRSILKPSLEAGGHKAGIDFGLAHSPERIDLKNREFPPERIPKLVGGIDKASTDVAAALYEAVLEAPVIRVQSPEVAEAAKMLENTYRFVNICLINELASLFEALNIDTFDVVKAASTKPFGFMPHYPGPGVGGHCIPKDPFYLIKAASKVGKSLTIVEAAQAFNSRFPRTIVSRIERTLKWIGKSIEGAQTTILGLSYKRNVSDLRRSPALGIIDELVKRGALVRVYDPLIKQVDLASVKSCQSLQEAVEGADVIVLVTDHDAFRSIDLTKIYPSLSKNPILFDARNFWNGSELARIGYQYLGVGKPSNVQADGSQQFSE